jgi:hypothetical protein
VIAADEVFVAGVKSLDVALVWWAVGLFVPTVAASAREYQIPYSVDRCASDQ